MKNQFLLACTTTLLTAFSFPALAGGNVYFSLGNRHLDEDYWGPVESQALLGVLANFGIGKSPVHIAVGIQASAQEEEASGITATGAVADITLGVQFMTQEGVFRPFFGLGLASVGATFEASAGGPTVEDDDQSFGLYINSGLLFRIGRHFDIGTDLRIIRGTEVELFGTKGDADSFVGSLIIGYGW